MNRKQSKIDKSITRWTVVSPVRQTGWTAADRVCCEKQAAAWSVTASVVNYLYFAVTIGMWGYTPVRMTGVLVFSFSFSYQFLGRPTYMSADLCFTRLSSSSSSSSFIRQLISELDERNSAIFGHIVGSKCNLKMHVRNLVYPFPQQIGAQKPPFGAYFATQWQL